MFFCLLLTFYWLFCTFKLNLETSKKKIFIFDSQYVNWLNKLINVDNNYDPDDKDKLDDDTFF